jgi:hypothetical protein
MLWKTSAVAWLETSRDRDTCETVHALQPTSPHTTVAASRPNTAILETVHKCTGPTSPDHVSYSESL